MATDTRDLSKNVFGVFMPQGWKMELSSIDGAQAKWQTAVDIAVLAEDLGTIRPPPSFSICATGWDFS